MQNKLAESQNEFNDKKLDLEKIDAHLSKIDNIL